MKTPVQVFLTLIDSSIKQIINKRKNKINYRYNCIETIRLKMDKLE